MSSELKNALVGDEPKHIAITKFYQQQLWKTFQKDPEDGPDDETIRSIANNLAPNGLKVNRPDVRYPNQNQLNNCWTALNEYQLCAKEAGQEDIRCLQKARDYGTLCPAKWIEDWKAHSEAGIGLTIGDLYQQ